MIGGLQVPAVSYAATNEKVDDIKPDTKLLKNFQKELKNILIIVKKILQSHIKQKLRMVEK